MHAIFFSPRDIHTKGLLVLLHLDIEVSLRLTLIQKGCLCLENKLILYDFNCTINEMERDGRNKRLYRCCFNYSLSKLTVDNGLEDLWRMRNPYSSKFTHHNKYSGRRSRIGRVYADIKIASNTKTNHKMVSSTNYFSIIFVGRLSSRFKIEKRFIIL